MSLLPHPPKTCPTPPAGRILPVLLSSAALLLMLGFGIGYVLSTQSISKILLENRELQAAVQNLTAESAVAVLRVLDQRRDPATGMQLYRIRFSELDPKNPRVVVRETETDVHGPLVYLEGMVVIFDTAWVRDGKERALFVWRRIFDEKTAPEMGIALNPVGEVPDRYLNWFGMERRARLSTVEVWEQLWHLALEPDRLQRQGIRAIQGQAHVLQLDPAFRYRLFLTAGGQVIAEPEPEI